jgi:hypothetical protein
MRVYLKRSYRPRKTDGRLFCGGGTQEAISGVPEWPRETMRMTYHIESRYVELIKEHARMEGVSITTMINRIIRQCFEGGA